MTFGIAYSFVVIAQSKALNTLGSLFEIHRECVLYQFFSP